MVVPENLNIDTALKLLLQLGVLKMGTALAPRGTEKLEIDG